MVCKFVPSPIDENMRIPKLHYVFSFILILFTCLSESGYAQEKGKIQKGSATWYGSKYHGRKTTSGEVYNKNQMTAAHPTLPFGTKVKVTNTASNKSVIVRINDRGPFGKKGHIIDLSEAAARKIDLHHNGYGKVTVQVLPAGAILEKDVELYSANTTPASDAAQARIDEAYLAVQASVLANQSQMRL